jgi:hypothetical protein
MSPSDAAKILDVPADASPEQLEARFLELRRKLEDKIAKAPTPGLQAKYRESLGEITTAFETLTLAADSSSLPVTTKQGAGSREQGVSTGGPVSAPAASNPSGLRSQVSGLPAAKRKSGSREFAIVAVIALALLSAGGWFVMKTRAENAEKERIAAEAKAEAERQAVAAKAEQERIAQVARVDAEEKKKAEEAERVRQEKLSAQLRADLAEAKVAWDAIEREERSVERRLAEVKADLRSLRDAPASKVAETAAIAAAQQDYYTWLSDTLARHPARIARGRAEELLSARQVDDAGRVMQQLSEALRTLEAEIPKQRQALLDLDGDLAIQTNPDASWTLTDAFGRTQRGKGPARLKDVAVGAAQLTATLPPWSERRKTVQISRSQAAIADAEFHGTTLQIVSDPVGATIADQNGRALGIAPMTVPNLPPATHKFTLSKPGFYPSTLEVAMTEEPNVRTVKLRAQGSGLSQPAVWRHPARLHLELTTVSTGSSSWNKRAIEEWVFSAPDSTGDWTQIDRTLVSEQIVGLGTISAMSHPGSVIRYQRRSDGKWESRFLQGGVTDPAFARAFGVFNFTPAMFGLGNCWPPDSVDVGGTWPVKLADLPGWSHTAKDLTGKASGKLLSTNREGNSDWATLEIDYDFIWQMTPDSKLEVSGTQRYKVNLTEGYVGEYSFRNKSSGSETTMTMRMSKR